MFCVFGIGVLRQTPQWNRRGRFQGVAEGFDSPINADTSTVKLQLNPKP